MANIVDVENSIYLHSNIELKNEGITIPDTENSKPGSSIDPDINDTPNNNQRPIGGPNGGSPDSIPGTDLKLKLDALSIVMEVGDSDETSVDIITNGHSLKVYSKPTNNVVCYIEDNKLKLLAFNEGFTDVYVQASLGTQTKTQVLRVQSVNTSETPSEIEPVVIPDLNALLSGITIEENETKYLYLYTNCTVFEIENNNQNSVFVDIIEDFDRYQLKIKGLSKATAKVKITGFIGDKSTYIELNINVLSKNDPYINCKTLVRVNENETITLYIDSNCKNLSLDKGSLSESTATVDLQNNNLIIKGILKGSTFFNIKGSIGDNEISKKIDIYVLHVSLIKQVTIESPSKNINAGEELQLTAKIFPEEYQEQCSLSWTASASGLVASVDSTGKVTAKKAGPVTISCSAVLNGNPDDSATDSINLNVIEEDYNFDAQITTSVLNKENSYLGNFNINTDENVEWSVSDSLNKLTFNPSGSIGSESNGNYQ